MNSEYLQIVVFAVIALFVVYRLRSVLGRRTGHESPRSDPYSQRPEPESARDNVVALPEREEQDAAAESPKTPLEEGLAQIALADRNFEPEAFTGGARSAFEMIVAGFAEGDLSRLKPFLAGEVYENFADAVQTRYDAREVLETTVVGIESTDILEARMDGRTAYITIKFVSEQINVTRDRNGEVVDGDPNAVRTVTDIWTFARDMRSRDPNWSLVETRSSN